MLTTICRPHQISDLNAHRDREPLLLPAKYTTLLAMANHRIPKVPLPPSNSLFCLTNIPLQLKLWRGLVNPTSQHLQKLHQNPQRTASGSVRPCNMTVLSSTENSIDGHPGAKSRPHRSTVNRAHLVYPCAKSTCLLDAEYVVRHIVDLVVVI